MSSGSDGGILDIGALWEKPLRGGCNVWLRQSTRPSTWPNSSPVDNCLLQEKQAKQARWYTLPRARRTQSLAYTCRPHWAHLVPNLLWGGGGGNGQLLCCRRDARHTEHSKHPKCQFSRYRSWISMPQLAHWFLAAGEQRHAASDGLDSPDSFFTSDLDCVTKYV
ncbi:hypothetical protein EYF80_029609 [Liparis tanakae]|uniref:Uncharacterized protein n=1 Tax=Liparis tanakae TaxID=230148 RepID=A0A4Z2H305_9TELE|nr:hypothetical protein EYF80_029609 [Liparis tanakae]